jgi:hypothetical protein
VLVLIGSALVGCASTPKAPETAGVVFSQPVDKAKRAAVDALVVLGFDVQKQEAAYVEGFRPRKIGLFVGSGGETVGVWLEPVTPERTRVRVDTAKSFAGYVGQKKWDSEVLAEMEKTLGKPE